ncbi:hypothetical protein BGP75_09655 [Motiliproteus sp. MSK22-1]|nr:hypothetical protein BGP75_09655 [Motiliproteus sp. MSK22-1]
MRQVGLHLGTTGVGNNWNNWGWEQLEQLWNNWGQIQQRKETIFLLTVSKSYKPTEILFSHHSYQYL